MGEGIPEGQLELVLHRMGELAEQQAVLEDSSYSLSQLRRAALEVFPEHIVDAALQEFTTVTPAVKLNRLERRLLAMRETWVRDGIYGGAHTVPYTAGTGDESVDGDIRYTARVSDAALVVDVHWCYPSKFLFWSYQAKRSLFDMKVLPGSEGFFKGKVGASEPRIDFSTPYAEDDFSLDEFVADYLSTGIDPDTHRLYKASFNYLLPSLDAIAAQSLAGMDF